MPKQKTTVKAKSAKGKPQPDLPAMEGPGVALPHIPEIDTAAEQYIKERDKRCAMTPREIAAKQKLIDVIHANADKIGADTNGEIVYRYDETVITLKPGREVLKVKDLTVHAEEEG